MVDAADLARFRGTFAPDLGRRLAVLASLCLVLLAAGSALFMVQGVERQMDDVVRTYEVRNEARELTIALAEAESSQRGYLLTRDPAYLDPYHRATNGIDARVERLLELTDGDDRQHRRIQSIVGEILQKTEEMARTVELVATGRSQEAQALTESGMGSRLMDGVRNTLEHFIGEENQNLLDRNASIDQSRRWLVGAVLAALAGSAILAFSLFQRTQRQVTALSRSQNVLLNQNEILEEHVRERTVELEEARAHAERERERVEALLQEANHRIGNSLATVSSLLGLQLMRSRSEEVRAALEAARSRVHAIASSHRRLRLGDDLETTNADDFLQSVLDDLATAVAASEGVTLAGEFEPIVIKARDATTVGIVVGELVTNALKHAFPDGRGGAITVRLARDTKGIPVLSVFDNGVGMPEGKEEAESGLGSVIIRQLAQQFGSVPVYRRREEGGMAVSLELPELDHTATS